MEKSFLNLHKKGNLFDYLEVGKFFIVAIILGFVVYTILTQFSGGIDKVDSVEGNYTTFIENSRDKVVGTTDWATLIFLITALIFSVIMARKIPTEPTYIAIMLVMSFVFLIIAFVLSNVFGRLMDSGTISTFVNLNMPVTKILLQYFPFVTAIYVAVVLMVFFNKD